jgi:hypothetical protein
MAEKSLDEAAALRIATELGIDVAKAKRRPAVAKAVHPASGRHSRPGQALAIEGTPAFIVGDHPDPRRRHERAEAGHRPGQGAGSLKKGLIASARGGR